MTDETDDVAPRLAIARWLATPDASAPLQEAGAALALHPRDPLAAAGALRRRLPHLAPDRAAAVLEQADLARVAEERYSIDPAARLLLTRDGLEQATRPEVAARRARLLRAAGASRILDITGGLGFDTAAFLAAGLAVTVVERDPVTAVMLAHNCPGATVVAADIAGSDEVGRGVLDAALATLSPLDVVYADPARRDPEGPRGTTTARARTERDPARWSPPWAFVQAIPHPRVTAKVAPSFVAPEGWQSEWTSVDRTVVECTVHSWPLNPADRRAVVMTGGSPTIVDAAHHDPALPIATALGAWLHEPDPAVQRAGAVGALRTFDADLMSLGPESSWLTSDRPSPTPAYRSYAVIEQLPGSARAIARRLAALEVRRLTVKSKDVTADPRRTLRDLHVQEGPEHVLVLTRREGRVVSLLAEPAVARRA